MHEDETATFLREQALFMKNLVSLEMNVQKIMLFVRTHDKKTPNRVLLVSPTSHCDSAKTTDIISLHAPSSEHQQDADVTIDPSLDTIYQNHEDSERILVDTAATVVAVVAAATPLLFYLRSIDHTHRLKIAFLLLLILLLLFVSLTQVFFVNDLASFFPPTLHISPSYFLLVDIFFPTTSSSSAHVRRNTKSSSDTVPPDSVLFFYSSSPPPLVVVPSFSSSSSSSSSEYDEDLHLWELYLCFLVVSSVVLLSVSRYYYSQL